VGEQRDAEGGPVTFDEFLSAELAGLRRYAAVLTGDPQRAHDVLTDALLRAHTGWKRIGGMEFPLAYVRRMVTSTFLSEKRRWSVRMIRLSPSGQLPDVALPDPAAAVDDRAQLHSLLAGLPPRQRAAVVLRYYLDLPDAGIAAELGISQPAVRTMISRALATLRIAVAEEEPGASGDRILPDDRGDAGGAGTADPAPAAARDTSGWRPPGQHDATVRPRLQEGS
jgi:RNA polymerase sigma-70 factor (sigma-E family)